MKRILISKALFRTFISFLNFHAFRNKEICDGTDGLFRLISPQSPNSVRTVASVKPQLCETAGSFFHSQNRYFVSWTCSKVPGIVSVKPSEADMISALHHLINHLNWRKLGFAKFENDKSTYCNNLASALETRLGRDGDKEKSNASIIVLSKYQNMYLSQYSALIESIQGVFLCISYDYGFTHRNSKTEKDPMKDSLSPLPLILLPEWPLPLEAIVPFIPFHGQNPKINEEEKGGQNSRNPSNILAVLSHPHPYKQRLQESHDSGTEAMLSLSSSSSTLDRQDAYQFSWESFTEFIPLELEDKRSSSKLRMWESLLAKLILRSIKVSLLDDPAGDSQFQFLLLKYENDRWHPLVNLVPGDNPSTFEGTTYGENNQHSFVNHSSRENDFDRSRNSIVSLLQFVGGATAIVFLIALAMWTALQLRERYQNYLYTTANNRDIPELSSQKKLVPRRRTQGPYKLLLTSRDICFNNVGGNANISSCNKPIQLSFDGGDGTGSGIVDSYNSFDRLPTHSHALYHSQHHLVSYSRSPSTEDTAEKPDLLKGYYGPSSSLTKVPSIANVKNESIVLSENQARYKGDLVHLRKLAEPTSEPFEIKTKALSVLDTIHGLRHENLVALIGVLTDGIPAMVWEFCTRGSLHDVLKHVDIKLDWTFKLSLLTDLVRGMKYLHSSLVRVHGFLTSYNCVIDARWVLKITNFGIYSFYHNQEIPLRSRSNKELLWTAPELLRDETLRKHGTQAGDVYSFAIIMQEILVRGEPFCMLNLSVEDILEKIRRPPPLIRPSVSKGVAPPEAINIMRQCWGELPDSRPDFTVIQDQFKTLNHGRKANIVDSMFEMLEKYSDNLEELIRERTQELDLEKKKTEQLLNRMLPSTVAEKLKLGLPVDPEEFSEVTIYFSDIVGFTTISAYSTPFEVVDLLNDLYTCFDATINNYNVYKVETIGDAYMVTGGAPVRSPDHTDQIATMALDLLHDSGKFRIKHLPFTPVRLRIGIHTGPVCGGVVGLTMPRYCLFGDTVNTASRMESTGAPWRIHISSNTKAKLESIGGYRIEYRGITDIKGKGKMPTYWLLGKEGFNKELPKPPPLSESHGLDEKSIIYGRTGIRPDSQDNLQLTSHLAFIHSRPNSKEGSASLSPSMSLDPGNGSGKVPPSFSHLQGDAALRCLSPAEEVAHQLLNGRPTIRGLRRQFSLDQGTSSYLPVGSSSKSLSYYRKTPSLEEHHQDNRLPRLEFSIEVPNPRTIFFNNPSFSTASRSASISHSNSTTASQTPISPGEKKTLSLDNNTEGNNNHSPSAVSSQINASSPNAKPNTNHPVTVTLSPRSGRTFNKASSLTILEESPTQE